MVKVLLLSPFMKRENIFCIWLHYLLVERPVVLCTKSDRRKDEDAVTFVTFYESINKYLGRNL